MTTVLIIDDEPLAAENLASKIRRVAPVTRVETLCDPLAALRRLRDEPPDIVFLDITMPELSGFELLAQLEEDERRFALVFCTAYSEYALAAFEAAALDYIVKPASPERVAEAVTRAVCALRGAWHRRFEASPLRPVLEKVTVRNGGGTAWLRDRDIVAVTSEAHETVVYTAVREYFCDLSLATLEARLDPTRFFRCHRSAVVNLDRVTRLDPNTSTVTVATEKGPLSLPVSRRSRTALKQRLRGYRQDSAWR